MYFEAFSNVKYYQIPHNTFYLHVLSIELLILKSKLPHSWIYIRGYVHMIQFLSFTTNSIIFFIFVTNVSLSGPGVGLVIIILFVIVVYHKFPTVLNLPLTKYSSPPAHPQTSHRIIHSTQYEYHTGKICFQILHSQM